MSKQAPHTLLLVKPAAFGFNEETSATNVFQQTGAYDRIEAANAARQEFDGVIRELDRYGIRTLVFEDTATPVKPDAVFPNNWISFHDSGQIVLYPMYAPNRRPERRQDIVDAVRGKFPRSLAAEVIDLHAYEQHGTFLEGTGSMVFDHLNRVIYACRSPRTDEALLQQLATRLGHTTVIFNAVDERGIPVYHTNVVLCLGSRFAVVCLDAIRSEADQDVLLDNFAATGRTVVAISYEQMRRFAGNMLEVSLPHGDSGILVSETAFNSLLPGQIHALTRFAEMIPLSVNTIETCGGGSIRCMIAGIHLPL
jgi:hypothetical protein